MLNPLDHRTCLPAGLETRDQNDRLLGKCVIRRLRAQRCPIRTYRRLNSVRIKQQKKTTAGCSLVSVESREKVSKSVCRWSVDKRSGVMGMPFRLHSRVLDVVCFQLNSKTTARNASMIAVEEFSTYRITSGHLENGGVRGATRRLQTCFCFCSPPPRSKQKSTT